MTTKIKKDIDDLGVPPVKTHSKNKKKRGDSQQSSKKDDKQSNLVKLVQDEEIGMYRITTEVLGMGSFGIVYKGFGLYSPNLPVAVKLVCKRDLNEHRTSRLKTEIELLQSLDHRSIIKLLNVYESDENVYLVFEYKNCDLYTFIQNNGPVSEMVAMEIFNHLVDAVAFCHSQGVVHLDIKLENILIDQETLEVYLADFGFANYYDKITKMEKWCGSPFTVAPEIINRAPYNPELVDLWALGSVLYTMLNGSYPYQAPTVDEVLRKTRAGKMNPFHSSVGYSVRDLIVKILVLDPSKRITLEQLKAHPWYRLAAGVSKVPEKIRAANGGMCTRRTGAEKQNSPRYIQSKR